MLPWAVLREPSANPARSTMILDLGSGTGRTDMANGLDGGCACGSVRYRLTSSPMFVHCCHCLNCQRQTGSAFVINMLIESDRVELVQGAPVPVAVPRDDGSSHLIFRCPQCQVAVWSEY